MQPQLSLHIVYPWTMQLFNSWIAYHLV